MHIAPRGGSPRKVNNIGAAAAERKASLDIALAEINSVRGEERLARLRDDQYQRWQRGERIRAEEYFARLPGLRVDAEAAVDLIFSEVLLRTEAGEKPQLQEYQARFPEHAEALRRQFELQEAMNSSPPGTPNAAAPESSTDETAGDSIPFDQIITLCERFKAERQTGGRPSIESYLDRVAEDARPALFRNLLALEVDIRRHCHEQPSVDDYLARFPQFGVIIGDLFAALAQTSALPGISKLAEGPVVPAATVSATSVLESIREHRLVEAAQLGELKALAASFPEARALAAELIRRGWLTPFQVNYLFHGRVRNLVLGSYVLLERLGEGGMGQVFKARHQKLGRVVALKLIRKDRLLQPDAVRRFRREVQAAAALSHPNIVHAFDADEIDGTHLLIMECVDGATDLARLVAQSGPLPVEKACEYIRQAALGLQHAHERGLVHRDIKPQNLLLTADGRTLKILDMGLARLVHPGGDSEQSGTLTQSGTIVGTPDYIAPEQARDSHIADIRADLYSLGCTFYFLLSGQVPFPGGNVTEKLLKHYMDTPTSLDQLVPGLPPAVVRLVQKLMARRPEDRFQTPAEVVAAIDQLANGAAKTPPPAAAVTARPRNPFSELWSGETEVISPKRRRKRRPSGSLLIWASLAATVLLVGLLVLLLRPPSGSETQNGEKHESVTKDLSDGTKTPKARRTVDDAWLRKVARLPADKQVPEVVAKLKELNPSFDGKETHKVEAGVVTELTFASDGVTDISPVPALAGLKVLNCVSRDTGKGTLTDLSPLKGMHLTSLECAYTQVADLSPLAGMPLGYLGCFRTRVKDLSPLKGMKLISLNCDTTEVSDLSPLKGMPLTTLNCSSTQVKDLSPLKGMPLTFLSIQDTKVVDVSPLKDMKLANLHLGGLKSESQLSDLSPLQGMPLTALTCSHSAVKDLSPLQGMPLVDLNCGITQVSDLSPLKGMKLTVLQCPGTGITDLTPLAGMPLRDLACHSTKVRDLSPLKDMKLRILGCSGTEVSDLSPLAGMPLTQLHCGHTKVSDLSPLRGMPLTILQCGDTKISDLSPLKGMKLTVLDIGLTKVADLLPVKDMPLTRIWIVGTQVKDLSVLRGMPLTLIWYDLKQDSDSHVVPSLSKLETINDMPAREFWQKLATELFPANPTQNTPRKVDDAWLNKVASVPGEWQLEPVMAKLKELNPGFDGNRKYVLESGEITQYEFLTDNVTDISPVRALTGLKELVCWGSSYDTGRLADLSPLKGMKLTQLNCLFNKQLSDLSPLEGMPLKGLRCGHSQVSDLSPIKGMKLTYLHCGASKVADLSALEGMPLTDLHCGEMPVSDLSPLKGMKLKSLRCGMTKVSDLSPLSGMPMTYLECSHIQVSDLSPLKGMPLATLVCAGLPVNDLTAAEGMPLTHLNIEGTKIADLSLLKGMKLSSLRCANTQVSDLSPLKGMPLQDLGLSNTRVADLSPLKGMALTVLHCPDTGIADLSPLQGMPLTDLVCQTTKVADLSPLKDMKLTSLGLNNTLVSDLSPLKGMPLMEFSCDNTKVHDLSPLKGMKLERLTCRHVLVSDLSPLVGMPLRRLNCDFKPERDAQILRSISTLEWINDKPAKDFWKEVAKELGTASPSTAAPRKVDEVWLKKVSALPAEVQLEAVVAKLKELNPGFDGKETHKIEGGEVTELNFLTDNVTDISPVRALGGLSGLDCHGSAAGAGKLVDLSPLTGMPLRTFRCSGTHVSDLSPLKGMNLTLLICDHTSVADLSPLKGMKLTFINIGGTAVVDLSPLKDMPLTSLSFWGTQVSDLSLLKGMPLTFLDFHHVGIMDLSPLRGIKLTQLYCGTQVADLSPLNGMPLELLSVNGPVADLSPLQGMPLWQLQIEGTKVADLSPLKGMKLKLFNCVRTKVSDLSPLQGMPLTTLDCSYTPISDLTPLTGMPLTDLKCQGTLIKNLTPLKGMKLTLLYCSETQVADLSPLAGMPLTELICNNTQVKDLTPLKGMKLSNLVCHTTSVSDLSPLTGMPLNQLIFSDTPVKDLSPLQGMKVGSLACHNTQVTDLSPLKTMTSLRGLSCDFKPERDFAILRSIPTLESINNKPAKEFWKEVEAKQP
jgi:serine/threonine protein kinase